MLVQNKKKGTLNTYILLLSVVISILLFQACSSNNAQNTFDIVTISIEVKEMLEAYHTAVNKDGLKAEFDYLDTTDAFFWIPPEFDKALNYNEVKRILLENVPSTEGIQFKWEKLEVFPLKENVATYHGIVLSSMPIDSAKMHQSRILESGTLIKRKDGWKLLSGQSINLKN